MGLLTAKRRCVLVTLLYVLNVMVIQVDPGEAYPVYDEIHLMDAEQGIWEYNASRLDDVRLWCGEVPGSSHTTVWLKDGIVMTPASNNERIQKHTDLLTILRLRKGDAGTYSCQIQDGINLELKESRSIRLSVIPPRATERTLEMQDDVSQCKSNNKPAEKTFLCLDMFLKRREMTHYYVRMAGSTVHIYCNAKGNPTPTVRWFKDDEPFVPYGYNHRVRKTSLRLSDITKYDAGFYTCKVANTLENSPIVYSTQLDIIERGYDGKPFFFEKLRNLSIVAGNQLLLNCSFFSGNILEIVYISKFDSEPKHLDVDTYFNAEVESRTKNQKLARTSNLLVIDNIMYSDQGWYSCLIGSTEGIDSTTAFIKVEDNDKVLDARPQTTTCRSTMNFDEQNSTPVVDKGITDALVESNVTPEGLDDEEPESDSYEFALFDWALYCGIALLAVLPGLILIVIGLDFCLHAKKIKVRDLESTKKLAFGYTKRIVVERRSVNNEQGLFPYPEVNIEKVQANTNGQEYELPMDPNWEFPREKLLLGKKIGEGAFGEVWLGQAEGIEQVKVNAVAVKTLKKPHTDEEMIDLISEMETMKELGKHVNIISLLGCCTRVGNLLLIMEFAEHGNLRDHLRNYRFQFMDKTVRLAMIPNQLDAINFRDLMSFALQVAHGMDYLVQKKYVHRDLAARNVLVGLGKVVKIADFGMTRSTFSSDYYRKNGDGRVPVKWMALESIIDRISTTQSDVWSYGILLYEIVTLGGTPYPAMPDVDKLLDFLKSGGRMLQPSNCPDELYMIMQSCWFEIPGTRPTFSRLAEEVERILEILTGTDYLDMGGVFPSEDVRTPPSSAENSACGMISFDPDFLKQVIEHGL